jgi:hypothetical protein
MHQTVLPSENSGTELPNKGTGRGAAVKTGLAKASHARGDEASKKKRTVNHLVSEARL